MGNVILVCGLNGVGKSTLAKALAKRLNCKFIDIEDIYFSKQDNQNYPYENSRPHDEVVSLLASIVNNDNDFVAASVTGRFGDGFISHLRSVIYIEVPREIRLERVYERSYALFGEKGREGGVFYEQVKSFHEFCESRDEKTVENWLSTVSCPIVRVDGTLPIDDNVELIVQKL
ncbi:MAG: AAA family ATPase [Eubacteriales bacterium]